MKIKKEQAYARGWILIDNLDMLFSHDLITKGFKHSVKAMITFVYPKEMASNEFAELSKDIPEFRKAYPLEYKGLKERVRELVVANDSTFFKVIKEAEVNDLLLLSKKTIFLKVFLF